MQLIEKRRFFNNECVYVVLWYMSSGNDKTNVMTFNPRGYQGWFSNTKRFCFVHRAWTINFFLAKIETLIYIELPYLDSWWRYISKNIKDDEWNLILIFYSVYLPYCIQNKCLSVALTNWYCQLQNYFHFIAANFDSFLGSFWCLRKLLFLSKYNRWWKLNEQTNKKDQ